MEIQTFHGKWIIFYSCYLCFHFILSFSSHVLPTVQCNVRYVKKACFSPLSLIVHLSLHSVSTIRFTLVIPSPRHDLRGPVFCLH